MAMDTPHTRKMGVLEQMKYLSEERLQERFRSLYWNSYDGENLLKKLLAECKEIDALTVSKLRPMSEEPEVPANKMSAYVLLYTAGMSVPRIARFDLHNGFDSDAKRDGVGWLYLPIYK